MVNASGMWREAVAAYRVMHLLQAEQHFINRDAVAGILGHVDVGCLPQQALVLDIRRHDERTLYGSIPGSMTLLSPSAPLHASWQKHNIFILYIRSAVHIC